MTPEQEQVYDLKQTGMTLRQVADQLGISHKAASRRWERAQRWIEADPIAKQAAQADGASGTPRAMWVKQDDRSTYYVFDAPSHDDDDKLDAIRDAFQNVPAYRPNPIAKRDDGMLTVYPLYDMHIGMMAWARETRGQDYDLDLAKSDLIASIENLSNRAPSADSALVILGGDTIHVNDHFNETPASKHHQDADGRFEKIVDTAIEAISHAIEAIAEKHHEVSVVVLRGNHDETSHIVLKAALKQRYRLSSAIRFPSISGWDKSEIYWFEHGNSMIVAHHGDKMPPQRLAMIAADQCPFYSSAKRRVILTGHVHSMKVQDFPGITHFSLRAFAPPDAYGSTFGGVRGLTAMTFSDVSGLSNIAFDPIDRN